MKIICAPDSFKESLTAEAAAKAMARGVATASAQAEVELCPIADGGDGTVDALLAATGGERRVAQVSDPLGEPVEARWGILGRSDEQMPTAVIEMAAASGLALVEASQRDPTRTSTFGTGQIIAAAMAAGARRIVLGIGGSATNDGGCGAASALGIRFVAAGGRVMDSRITGGMVASIERIDISGLDPHLAETQIIVACDVRNPLTGPDGASHVYGPQKGATPQQIEQLDAALGHLAKLFREQLGLDVETMPGAGAAGGLGAGLVALLSGTLRGGVQIVLDAVDFERRVAGCDLCLTGEGRLDGSSLSGKACLGVARVAQRHGVRTIALVGSVGPGADRTLDAGLWAYHAIGEGLSVAESIRRAEQLLERSTARVVYDLEHGV